MGNAINARGLADLKAALIERHRKLREEVVASLEESEKASYQELAGRVHDAPEASVAHLLVDLWLFDRERDINEIRDIEAALERMREGSYGVCTDCGDPIPLERLKAYPTAKRCRPCQARYEQLRGRARTPSL